MSPDELKAIEELLNYKHRGPGYIDDIQATQEKVAAQLARITNKKDKPNQ